MIADHNESHRKRCRKSLDGHPIFPYILIFPSLIVIFGVFLYPMIYSAFMSLNEIDLASDTWLFSGIVYYIDIFKDKYFVSSVGRTIIFTVITVAWEIVIGTLIAVLLNQKFKGRGFVRGIMILPWALPTVVNAIMWKWIFNANYGVLNALLENVGIIDGYQIWLGGEISAFICVIIANIWKETPYVVLLTIAALSGIDDTLYEAAKVDGCGGIKAFFYITLPSIKPTVLILTVTKTIWAFQTFDLVYIMTAGGPGKSTELLTYYIYRNTFKFLDFGSGAAMSYVLMLVTFILSYLYIKALSKNNEVI